MAGTAMEVNVAGFKRDMVRFAKETGQDLAEVMKEGMRLWCTDLMRRFPPSKKLFSKQAFAALGAKSEKKLGERALEKSVNEIFVPISSQERQHIREFGPGSLGGKFRFKSKTGAVWVVDADMYKPNAAQDVMKRFHDRQRGADGRTRAHTAERKIGRWKAIRKLHVNQVNLKAYLKHRKKRVGALKGGWVAGVQKWGGKAPAWIAKHRNMGTASGSIDKDGNGSLVAVNKVPWAGQYNRIVAFTLRLRQKDFEKNAFLRLKKRTAKENARRVA